MKKYFTLLALLSLLFVNESDAQKLTFLDSFDSRVSSPYYSFNYIDSFPNLFENSKGELVGYAIDLSSNTFYEHILQNGKFIKSDSSDYDGDSISHITVGREFKGVRTVSHYSYDWVKPVLKESWSTMSFSPQNKNKHLGSWDNKNGFSSFTNKLRDSNVFVRHVDGGMIYKNKFYFQGNVMGQGHAGETGFFVFDGDSIKEIPIDVKNFRRTEGYEVMNDTIFFVGYGLRSSDPHNVYSCDLKTGKIHNQNGIFNMTGWQNTHNQYEYLPHGLASGRYYRRVIEVATGNEKLIVQGFGVIPSPPKMHRNMDATVKNGKFYIAHVNVANNNRDTLFISVYSNGTWSKTPINVKGYYGLARFIDGNKKLYLTYNGYKWPKKYNKVDIRHYVYGVDLSATSSVIQINESKFSVYPNPSSSVCNIRCAVNEKIRRIELFDIMGTPIATYDVNSYQHQLDISDLPTGMYVVRINEERTLRIAKSDQ